MGWEWVTALVCQRIKRVVRLISSNQSFRLPPARHEDSLDQTMTPLPTLSNIKDPLVVIMSINDHSRCLQKQRPNGDLSFRHPT